MQYPVKYSEAAVQEAIDRVYTQLSPLAENTIFLVLMNGGVGFSHEFWEKGNVESVA